MIARQNDPATTPPLLFICLDAHGVTAVIDPGATTEREWLARAPLRRPLLAALSAQHARRRRASRYTA